MPLPQLSTAALVRDPAAGDAHLDPTDRDGLYEGGRIAEAACWAHVRRKFFDVHAATGSPIAKEALARIAGLYAVEAAINGLSADERRRRRQAQSVPIAQALKTWEEEALPKLSGRSQLAAALRSRWTALMRCFGDGRLALDNNAAERALRGVAIGRKNWLFAGSDRGGARAAAMYSLIETAKAFARIANRRKRAAAKLGR